MHFPPLTAVIFWRTLYSCAVIAPTWVHWNADLHNCASLRCPATACLPHKLGKGADQIFAYLLPASPIAWMDGGTEVGHGSRVRHNPLSFSLLPPFEKCSTKHATFVCLSISYRSSYVPPKAQVRVFAGSTKLSHNTYKEAENAENFFEHTRFCWLQSTRDSVADVEEWRLKCSLLGFISVDRSFITRRESPRSHRGIRSFTPNEVPPNWSYAA